MAAHSAEASLLVFAIGLLVGGFAIFVGAKVALKSESYSHAVVTALLGALAWVGVDLLFIRVGIEGLLASIVGLLVWVWVVRWRYEVGWIRASVIGVGAWIAALFTLGLLALFGVGGLEAYGVPGA